MGDKTLTLTTISIGPTLAPAPRRAVKLLMFKEKDEWIGTIPAKGIFVEVEQGHKISVSYSSYEDFDDD